MKLCWGLSSYCVKGQGIGLGRWMGNFKTPVTPGQTYKVMLYYQIDGYSFSHALQGRMGNCLWGCYVPMW